jgi:hypothetical protein
MFLNQIIRKRNDIKSFFQYNSGNFQRYKDDYQNINDKLYFTLNN